MTKVTQRTITNLLTAYTWDCPGCGAAMEKYTTPPRTDDDMLCNRCLEAKKLAEFQANFVPVIGATVESIEPYDVMLFSNDCAKFILLRTQDGKLWKTHTERAIYLDPVEAPDESPR